MTTVDSGGLARSRPFFKRKPGAGSGLSPAGRVLGTGAWHSVYVGLLAVLLLLVVGIAIKALVPLNGVSIDGTRVLPRTDAGSMPWPWSVAGALGQPEVDYPGSQSVAVTIFNAMLYSLHLAAIGFGIGVVLGVLLGLLMYSVEVAERALMPFILVVPTVPIVVVAPLIAVWSAHIVIFGEQWQPWMTVALVTAVLSFWPLAAGLTRGLNSPTVESRELLHCLAGSRRDTLFRLSLPSAVPYILPALRVAAAAAVVSDIVSEISTGVTGGIGALIIQDIPQASSDGSRLFAAVFAAGLLGIFAVGLVSLIELPLRRYRGGAA